MGLWGGQALSLSVSELLADAEGLKSYTWRPMAVYGYKEKAEDRKEEGGSG